MKKHLIINEDSLAIAISNIKNYAKNKEPFNVLIQPILEKKTGKQLRYYWVIISIITEWANEQGNNLTKEEMSNEMKRLFFYKTATINNKTSKVLKSISNQSPTNIEEMKEFINKIVLWCAEWGIDIPFCDKDYNFHLI